MIQVKTPLYNCFMPNEITIDEFKKVLESSNNCQVIDVREQPEFDFVRIPGAKLLPLSEIETKHILIDKNNKAYIHCGVGKRAEKAALYLESLGYKNLCIINGGIKAWIEAGYPVESG